MSGPTNCKAERPVSDELAAVGALSFSGTATADFGSQLIQTTYAQSSTVDRSLPLG